MSEERAPLVYDTDLIEREVEECWPSKREGRSSDQIKHELLARGVAKHNANMVLMELDKRQHEHNERRSAKFQLLAAIVLLLVISVFTVYGYFQGWIIFMIGPLVFSIGLLFKSIERLKD